MLSFPLSEKAFARRLKEWRRKKSYDNRAVWEQGVKMDGVVHVEEDPDTVTRDGVTLTRAEFRDARSVLLSVVPIPVICFQNQTRGTILYTPSYGEGFFRIVV